MNIQKELNNILWSIYKKSHYSTGSPVSAKDDVGIKMQKQEMNELLI